MKKASYRMRFKISKDTHTHANQTTLHPHRYVDALRTHTDLTTVLLLGRDSGLEDGEQRALLSFVVA